MKFIDGRTIKLDRILNELDKLVISFIKILEKHTEYVIVSGYVAILFGRSRTTEDVDIIIPELPKEKLASLFDELTKSGYWFLNSSKMDDVYDLLTSKASARAAIDGEISPNFELKFEKTRTDRLALKNKLRVIMGENHLFTAPLELQILYKEKVLKSFKDLEDATHLRVVFSKYLNSKEFELYRGVIEKQGY
ncbi:hypothetical protein HYV82_00570 [Candidatus Woesearchaeota archaeon]|nr:hypothetical protein [Candidatus Woesearchaeota archaeon]